MRRPGPNVRGLRDLRTTKSEFRKLLSYRTYWFAPTRSGDLRQTMSIVRKHEERIAYYVKTKFTGADPIPILDVLEQFVSQAKNWALTEMEAYALLLQFLDGAALQHSNSAARAP